jgi:hypothetical protein
LSAWLASERHRLRQSDDAALMALRRMARNRNFLAGFNKTVA